MRHIYFHKRDEHGRILLPGNVSEGTPALKKREAFLANCRHMKLTDRQIDEKWNAMMDRIAEGKG